MSFGKKSDEIHKVELAFTFNFTGIVPYENFWIFHQLDFVTPVHAL